MKAGAVNFMPSIQLFFFLPLKLYLQKGSSSITLDFLARYQQNSLLKKDLVLIF